MSVSLMRHLVYFKSGDSSVFIKAEKFPLNITSNVASPYFLYSLFPEVLLLNHQNLPFSPNFSFKFCSMTFLHHIQRISWVLSSILLIFFYTLMSEIHSLFRYLFSTSFFFIPICPWVLSVGLYFMVNCSILQDYYFFWYLRILNILFQSHF